MNHTTNLSFDRDEILTLFENFYEIAAPTGLPEENYDICVSLLEDIFMGHEPAISSASPAAKLVNIFLGSFRINRRQDRYKFAYANLVAEGSILEESMG